MARAGGRAVHAGASEGRDIGARGGVLRCRAVERVLGGYTTSSVTLVHSRLLGDDDRCRSAREFVF